MTQYEFLALVEALSTQCPVRPSALIDDAVDIDVGDTLTSVQWSEDTQLIELTIALPLALDDHESPGVLLSLFRALLERQWLEMGGDEGVGFGLLPTSDEVVGMTSLDGDDIAGPDEFMAALQRAVVAVLAEWYGVCGQVLMQQNAQAAAHPVSGPVQPSPALVQV